MSNPLVPIAPVASESGTLRVQPAGLNADFLAHLIATSAQDPQTRARRRAEPHDAVSAYRALGQWPTKTGRALSRSL